MRRSQSLLIILLLTLSFANAIHPAKADYSVSVTINDAYYSDLDGDGLQDDIRIDLTVVLSNKYVYTDIDLYLGLTLPSGIEYWFLHSFTLQKSTIVAQVNFYYLTQPMNLVGIRQMLLDLPKEKGSHIWILIFLILQGNTMEQVPVVLPTSTRIIHPNFSSNLIHSY